MEKSITTIHTQHCSNSTLYFILKSLPTIHTQKNNSLTFSIKNEEKKLKKKNEKKNTIGLSLETIKMKNLQKKVTDSVCYLVFVNKDDKL